MSLLKSKYSTSVILTKRTATATADAFNRTIYTTSTETVKGVLIKPASAEDIETALNLTGEKIRYTLHIPKGDTNDWRNTTVSFWGRTWRTIGDVIGPNNPPLDWRGWIGVTNEQ